MAVKKFAIQYPYDNSSEQQSVASIKAAAAKLGIEVEAFRDSDDIIQFQPEFVLSIAHQDPKLTPFPTYGVMTAPSSFYETPRFIRNILTYDGYLTVTKPMKEWLGDLTFGARKIDTPVGFYANTIEVVENPTEINFANASLAYVGTNWDGNRHGDLFDHLLDCDLIHLYGPEGAWKQQLARYAGSLPFDGISVQKAYMKHGVALCLDHPEFAAEGMPSNRIYEALSCGALAICSDTPFNREWFGDNVLYVDQSQPPKLVAHLLERHIAWVREHPDAAQDKATNAARIYREKLSLDILLKNLLDYHEMMFVKKGYESFQASNPDQAPLTGTIMRAGGRDKFFLSRAIGSFAAQGYPNKILIVVAWQDHPDIDKTLAQYPDLKVHKVSLPKGSRSECLWKGLTEARDLGVELVGILDDDDELHPNMLNMLVHTYQYHQGLSFHSPIAMITGGSLWGYDSKKKRYVDMADKNSLLRPETRYINQFHFGSNGQVNDVSFASSPASVLMVTRFLDAEILQNPHLDVAEDYYIWLQLAERGRIVFCPEVVATIHEHGVDQSNFKEDNLANNSQHARIAKRMLGRRFNAIESYRPNPHRRIQQCDHLKATHNFLNRDQYSDKLVFSPVPPFVCREKDSFTTFDNLMAGTYRVQIILQASSPLIDDLTGLEIKSRRRRQILTWQRQETEMQHEGVMFEAEFTVLAEEAAAPIEMILPISDHTDVFGCFWAIDNGKRLVPVEKLKSYGRVWLYGASNFSEIGYDLLAGMGLTPCGIADTYQTGVWKDFSIVNPEQLKAQLRPNDVILITSFYWKEINSALKEMEIWTDCLTIYDLNVPSEEMQLFFLY